MPDTHNTLRLSVSGMHCGACEKLVSAEARKVEGVVDVTADAAAGLLTVTTDRELGPDAFVDAIVAAGFTPGTPLLLVGGAPNPAQAQASDPDAEGEGEPAQEASRGASPSAAPMETPREPASEAGSPSPPSAELDELTFAVGGMTCASCASLIEKVLPKTDGVESANVNLATEKLVARFDPAVTDVAAIVQAVSKLGYTATPLDGRPMTKSGDGTTARVTLSLIGMHCASCSTLIEKSLNALPGVKSAAVNLAIETGTVEFDPIVVGVDDIIGAVKAAGYQATVKVDAAAGGGPVEDVAKAAHARAYAHDKRMFAISLALSLPLLFVAMIPPFMMTVPLAVAEFLAQAIGGAWDPMMVGK